MARCFFNLARNLKTLTLTLTPTRNYISSMRRSAFKDRLLRHLRSEIPASGDLPSPPSTFAAFSIDNLPGERWIRLTRAHRHETVKIEATMVDGAAPSTRSNAGDDSSARLHISVIVEVSKGEACDFVLQFVCSAYPDALDVENVVPMRKGVKPIEPFKGPDFWELDKELQSAVMEYLEERGVNDELAEFLHGYMETKHKGELVRWLKNVESYVKKKGKGSNDSGSIHSIRDVERKMELDKH